MAGDNENGRVLDRQVGNGHEKTRITGLNTTVPRPYLLISALDYIFHSYRRDLILYMSLLTRKSLAYTSESNASI